MKTTKKDVETLHKYFEDNNIERVSKVNSGNKIGLCVILSETEKEKLNGFIIFNKIKVTTANTPNGINITIYK